MKLAELLRKRTTYEFLFSLYLSVLIISVEEMRWSWSWIIRFRIFSYFNPQLRKPTDDPHPARLIAFLLLWLLVIIIFLCLRLLSRFSSSRVPLDIAAGLVALGGMPTAIWFRGLGNRALLLAQIVLSLVCAFLNVLGKWRGSPRTNLALLALYFIFSTWVAWQSWST